MPYVDYQFPAHSDQIWIFYVSYEACCLAHLACFVGNPASEIPNLKYI